MSLDRQNTDEDKVSGFIDGELSDSEKTVVSENPELLKLAGQLGAVGKLVRETYPEYSADDITVSRSWNAISAGIKASSQKRIQRRKMMIGIPAAAAAALLIFFSVPFRGPLLNKPLVEVESIDCTYDSFTLLPASESSENTIIWINDSNFN